MSISTLLVEKFFRGNCTEEERQQVAAWFRDNPEELAQYLTEDTWENFTSDTLQEVPSEKMRLAIEEKIGPAPAPLTVVKRFTYGWVAAASVIAAIALFFLLHKNTGDRTIPELADAKPSPQKTYYGFTTVDNPSSRAKIFILPDSSKIELSARTSISFDSTFPHGRRDIILQQGEAVFTVKKDPRPFTVHSKGITTTALGTVFSVSDKQRLFTTVHLFSGKVVIKKDAGEPGKSFKDIYLKPGQQLMLNKEDFSVRVKDIAPPATTVPVTPAQAPATPQQMLNFTNQPVAEILSLLQQEYKVSISYDAAALQNMTFTGKLNRDKESLESFLSTLCDLNDLSLKKINDNSFAIQQKQP